MAERQKAQLPVIETEKKIGNTTYIVNGTFAPQGSTIKDKIKRLLLSEEITQKQG